MRPKRSRSCTGKARHKTIHAANIALRISTQQYGDLGMTAYQCDSCGGFHIGHPSKADQQRLRFSRLIKLIEKANRPER